MKFKNISVNNYQGHNRSKAAIIEVCILASRVNLLDENKIFSELEYLKISVETAGPKEKRSWEKILKYINEKIYEK